ncbi:receptor-type tyrosine-protein phosphatase T [Elysia marginata]|uniref:Receptor-type tyrosine-protein phosphatase T n=1 Tax=Elysia marginata TaxID=1093978 RepID=A0AAV4J1M6_9GAST|nr:receptor-type tyrosine-protein phosphatase T [Elysia marginata]
MNKFVWLDHIEEAAYTNWRSNTPPNVADKDCVVLRTGGYWGVKKCDSKEGFICERFSACENERYGTTCAEKCANCVNSEYGCDRRIGDCFHGCVPGYHGVKCLMGN